MSNEKPVRPSRLASSVISIFITNLRLLDLDKRDDWPSISPQTLVGKDAGPNQKIRILCVEWALYRLFEIWNAKEAQDVRPRLSVL